MLLGALVLGACSTRSGDTRFERLSPHATGITFANELPESDSFNILRYEYIYNGGGVGVGDFDGDGRPDLVFAGNRVPSALYLQRAPWEFEDVSSASGFDTRGTWCAGVTVSDFDGDGRDDIYLSTLNLEGTPDTPNLLFLNRGTDAEGTPQFEEAAAALGLDDRGYSTHAAHADLDGDGALDLYVLNNAVESSPRNTPRPIDTSGRARSVDRVYFAGRTEPVVQAQEGWGLGIAAQDFDGDQRTDLYIGNDFLSNDMLLLSDGTGGFHESVRRALPHTSYNTMGVDVADLDGDAQPELLSVDMFPDDGLRQKTMFGDIGHATDRQANERGYVRQYVHNALQRNNGDGTFSDIGWLTGVAATDWSWAALLADFDNDGRRDIYISNGYPKDITDKDFTDYASSATQFGTEASQVEKISAALKDVGGVHQADFMFRNDGALTFENVSAAWLGERPTYTNGAAFVDLDGDGDLDLVTNEINAPAGVLRNRTRERDSSSTHFLQLELAGGAAATRGAKVYALADSLTMYHEHHTQRGYLSTVQDLVHLGLGTRSHLDTLVVRWPDGRSTQLINVAANQRLRLDPAAATSDTFHVPRWAEPPRPTLTAIPTQGAPRHVESPGSDFDREALAQRDRSRDGPSLAVMQLGGAEVLVVGGAAGQPTEVFALNGDTWTRQQTLAATTAGEATALLAFDYDGDGDDDLLIGNGSSEFGTVSTALADLLYRQTPAGTLELVPDALPYPPGLTSALAAGDFDGDGQADVFVGTLHEVGAYPRAVESYLLEFAGGRIALVRTLALGMVSAAVADDATGDGVDDVLVAGQFEPVRLFRGSEGMGLAPVAVEVAPRGLWYSLSAADLDEDGLPEVLAGNISANSFLRASAREPLRVRVDDYDGNGRLDPIWTMYQQGVSVPIHPRNTLGRQLPKLKQAMPSYAEYAGWTSERLPPVGDAGFYLEATELRNVLLVNEGDGAFELQPLPALGQLSPVRAAVPVRVPSGYRGPLREGQRVLLAAGNDHATEVLTGRMDAGTGFAVGLRGGLPVVDADYWSVRTDARGVAALGRRIVVGSNDAALRVYGGVNDN